MWDGYAKRTLFLTEEQKKIQPLFNIEELVRHFGLRIDEVRKEMKNDWNTMIEPTLEWAQSFNGRLKVGIQKLC